MAVTDELRAKYKALKKEADKASEFAKPERDAYLKALEPLRDIMAKIDALELGPVTICEGCSEPIFEGDAAHHDHVNCCNLCAECAPTYGDLITDPQSFSSPDGEDFDPAVLKKIADDHVAAGGSLSDKYGLLPYGGF